MGVAKGEKRMTARANVQFAAVILMIALSGNVYADDLDDGIAATEQGDYLTAFTKFMKAAVQGDEIAQSFLASMYDEGL